MRTFCTVQRRRPRDPCRFPERFCSEGKGEGSGLEACWSCGEAVERKGRTSSAKLRPRRGRDKDECVPVVKLPRKNVPSIRYMYLCTSCMCSAALVFSTQALGGETGTRGSEQVPATSAPTGGGVAAKVLYTWHSARARLLPSTPRYRTESLGWRSLSSPASRLPPPSPPHLQHRTKHCLRKGKNDRTPYRALQSPAWLCSGAPRQLAGPAASRGPPPPRAAACPVPCPHRPLPRAASTAGDQMLRKGREKKQGADHVCLQSSGHRRPHLARGNGGLSLTRLWARRACSGFFSPLTAARVDESICPASGACRFWSDRASKVASAMGKGQGALASGCARSLSAKGQGCLPRRTAAACNTHRTPADPPARPVAGELPRTSRLVRSVSCKSPSA